MIRKYIFGIALTLFIGNSASIFSDTPTAPQTILDAAPRVKVEVPGTTGLWGFGARSPFTLQAAQIYWIHRCRNERLNSPCVSTILLPENVDEKDGGSHHAHITQDHLKRAASHLSASPVMPVSASSNELPGIYTSKDQVAYSVPSEGWGFVNKSRKFLHPSPFGEYWSGPKTHEQYAEEKRLNREERAENLKELQNTLANSVSHQYTPDNILISSEQPLQDSDWIAHFQREGKAPAPTIKNELIDTLAMMKMLQARKQQ